MHDAPYTLDLTLGHVWVESRSAKLTELRGSIVATFVFHAALLKTPQEQSLAQTTLQGEGVQKVVYFYARDHQRTLNQAYCEALRHFESWLTSHILPVQEQYRISYSRQQKIPHEFSYGPFIEYPSEM
jgi:hypothetical protein